MVDWDIPEGMKATRVVVMFQFDGRMFRAHKIGERFATATTGAQLKQRIIDRQSHDLVGIPRDCDIGSFVLNRFVDRKIMQEIGENTTLAESGVNDEEMLGGGMGILMTATEEIDAGAWSATMKPILLKFAPTKR